MILMHCYLEASGRALLKFKSPVTDTTGKLCTMVLQGILRIFVRQLTVTQSLYGISTTISLGSVQMQIAISKSGLFQTNFQKNFKETVSYQKRWTSLICPKHGKTRSMPWGLLIKSTWWSFTCPNCSLTSFILTSCRTLTEQSTTGSILLWTKYHHRVVAKEKDYTFASWNSEEEDHGHQSAYSSETICRRLGISVWNGVRSFQVCNTKLQVILHWLHHGNYVVDPARLLQLYSTSGSRKEDGSPIKTGRINMLVL